MENKFDLAAAIEDNERKTIPKTLSECYQPSRLVRAIRGLAKNIVRIGVIILIISLIVGIIEAISGSLVYSYDIFGTADEIEGFNFGIFLTFIINLAIKVLIIVGAFNFAALIMNALANLVYNTNITANIALYEANKREMKEAAGASSNDGAER